MSATWNNWIEAPKSMDVENAIRKYCHNHNITIHSLYSKEVGRDIFDKMLGIKRETIYFKLEGDYDILKHLQQQLIKNYCEEQD